MKKLLLPILLTTISLYGMGQEKPKSIACPATAMGQLACEAVQKLNSASPAELDTWAASVSAAMSAEDKAQFADTLRQMQEESGGVELVEAREGRMPGSAVLMLRAKKAPGYMQLVFFPDRSDAQKVGSFVSFPADDPKLYADWPAAKLPQAQMLAAVRSQLERLVRSKDFSGCVSVFGKGQTLMQQCVGLAERTFGVRNAADTKFHIGSMDKMFTGVAIAQLVAEGKLSYDTTLAKAVPEYPDHAVAEKVTIGELLHHTAGFGDFFVPEFFEHREKYVNPADYIPLIAKQPMVGEPGKRFSYSNAGFVLLGRAVEVASGENYFGYVAKHIFAPAGMSASGWDSVEDVTPNLAVGYMRTDPFAIGAWKANWMTLPVKGSPAGGGYSTPNDLILFSQALQAGKLMPAAAVQGMFENEVQPFPGHEYGTGFDDRTVAGKHIRGHNGGAPGMNAELDMIWGTDYAVAVTSNEDGRTASDFAEHIADLLAQQ